LRDYSGFSRYNWVSNNEKYPWINPMIGPNSTSGRLAKLDGRSKEAKFQRQVQTELIGALGGEDRVTFAQRMLVGLAAIKALRLMMLAERLIAENNPPEEVDRRFAWFSNSLRRDLQALGLERAANAKVPSLSSYIQGHAA
jgi:hypothetical protein